MIPAGRAILLLSCPDRKGIVAAVADFLYKRGANIIHASQHGDPEQNLFFMRVEWQADAALDLGKFLGQFRPIAEKFQMLWRMEEAFRPLRAAIFCSKDDHCLADILYRRKAGELACEIPLIISNHETAKELADFYDVPFHHIPSQDKAKAEDRQLKLLKENSADLVVLARYMQILSPGFVDRYASRIINVHHSFLPAFTGSKPYHQAFERGVKLIGATSHYVTETLDQGPIIEQDVARVSHRDQIPDIIRKGRELEKSVLSRAVRWHTEHRILIYSKKTVVFD